MNGQPLRYLSLFSGIGGFDLGFDRAGMVCAGQVEFDDYCRRVLAKHWPDVKRMADIKEVEGDDFGAVDVICGGFPCQDVSVAGRRAGLAGERSGLWHEFHRLIDRAKPGTVVIENVPGLLSSNGGQDFATVLRGLVECGYGVAWRILDAQYFGVPQRRRRVFIVGSLGSGRAAKVLFERDGGAGDSAPGRGQRPELAATVTAQPPSRRNGGSWPTPGQWLSHALTAEGHDASEDGTGRGVPLVTTTFNGYTGGADDNDAQGGHLVMAFEPYHDEHEGRGANFRPANSHGALRGPNGTDNMLVKATHGVRRLTPVECERLQGFPDGHTEGQSDSARYRQLGNAVAVPVAEWIGRRIVAAKQQEKPQ